MSHGPGGRRISTRRDAVAPEIPTGKILDVVAPEIPTGKITADACCPARPPGVPAFPEGRRRPPRRRTARRAGERRRGQAPEVRKWLAKPGSRQITLHFTPAGCWRLNMVEIFFGIITHQTIRRGTFTPAKAPAPPSDDSPRLLRPLSAIHLDQRRRIARQNQTIKN